MKVHILKREIDACVCECVCIMYVCVCTSVCVCLQEFDIDTKDSIIINNLRFCL